MDVISKTICLYSIETWTWLVYKQTNMNEQYIEPRKNSLFAENWKLIAENTVAKYFFNGQNIVHAFCASWLVCVL